MRNSAAVSVCCNTDEEADLDLLPHPNWIAARAAYWLAKENMEQILKKNSSFFRPMEN